MAYNVFSQTTWCPTNTSRQIFRIRSLKKFFVDYFGFCSDFVDYFLEPPNLSGFLFLDGDAGSYFDLRQFMEKGLSHCEPLCAILSSLGINRPFVTSVNVILLGTFGVLSSLLWEKSGWCRDQLCWWVCWRLRRGWRWIGGWKRLGGGSFGRKGIVDILHKRSCSYWFLFLSLLLFLFFFFFVGKTKFIGIHSSIHGVSRGILHRELFVINWLFLGSSVFCIALWRWFWKEFLFLAFFVYTVCRWESPPFSWLDYL